MRLSSINQLLVLALSSAIASSATCGDGYVGDGDCPNAIEGECCSIYGYCGLGLAYCGESGLGGGEGFCEIETKACLTEGECCSQTGYCGLGLAYCGDGTGGGGMGLCEPDSTCLTGGECCSEYGYCGTGTDYCGLPGNSYCTFAPDTTCYESGWPSCCVDEATCPEEQPPCETAPPSPEPTDGGSDLVGSSYCTFAPDTTCYESGWPSCCVDEATCPEEQPPCEIAPPSPEPTDGGSDENGIDTPLPTERPSPQPTDGGSGWGGDAHIDTPSPTEEPTAGWGGDAHIDTPSPTEEPTAGWGGDAHIDTPSPTDEPTAGWGGDAHIDTPSPTEEPTAGWGGDAHIDTAHPTLNPTSSDWSGSSGGGSGWGGSSGSSSGSSGSGDSAGWLFSTESGKSGKSGKSSKGSKSGSKSSKGTSGSSGWGSSGGELYQVSSYITEANSSPIAATSSMPCILLAAIVIAILKW